MCRLANSGIAPTQQTWLLTHPNGQEYDITDSPLFFDGIPWDSVNWAQVHTYLYVVNPRFGPGSYHDGSHNIVYLDAHVGTRKRGDPTPFD